jgi:hypothetical protein
MGFSLEVFMAELEALLEVPDLGPGERLMLLSKRVAAARKYATECGQLENS